MNGKVARKIRQLAITGYSLCSPKDKKVYSFRQFYKELKRMTNEARKSNKRVS